MYNFGPCTAMDFSYNHIGQWHIQMLFCLVLYLGLLFAKKVYDYRRGGGVKVMVNLVHKNPRRYYMVSMGLTSSCVKILSLGL